MHPPTYRPFYAFVHLTKFAGRVGGAGSRATIWILPLSTVSRKKASFSFERFFPPLLSHYKKKKKEGKRKQTLLFHHRRFAERSITAEKYHRIRLCLPSSGKVAAVGVVLAIDVFHTI